MFHVDFCGVFKASLIPTVNPPSACRSENSSGYRSTLPQGEGGGEIRYLHVRIRSGYVETLVFPRFLVLLYCGGGFT